MSFGIQLYKRYVDDIFCLFSDENQIDTFFNFINNQHPNIKFTFEKQINGVLPFLDISIKSNEDFTFSTTTFRKKTYTGLLLNFFSFTPSGYKVGLIRTLIDRAYKINSSWGGFDVDCNAIKNILQKNNFPLNMVNSGIRAYLDSLHEQKEQVQNPPEARFFKLPFTGKYSSYTKKKLQNVLEKYCKDISVKLVFTTFKIGSMFSLKDSIPNDLKSNVVYKFSCASCNACYVGETTRHLATRIKEHLRSDKNSHVYKHIHAFENCFDNCDNDCFSVLDSASTQYQLRLKEAMHIQWEKPNLNRQVKHINLTLTV